MILAILFILAGFALLIWSADTFISGAVSIATNTGMSKLLIGLTIVAFGTSAPEMLVSLLAALNGANDLAIGNAIGSNITNMGLVLGVTALFVAIPVNVRLLKVDLPLLLFASLAAGVIIFDYKITLLESLILLAVLVLYLFYLYKQRNSPENTEDSSQNEVDDYAVLSSKKAWLYFLVGLIVLIASAQMLVKGAIFVAQYYHVSELVIGVTIIALGTSLPELAASLASALRGHHDIAFGNIVGSNIFNLLVVLAMPGFVNTNQLDHAVLSRDFSCMIALTLAWFFMLLILFWLKRPFSKLCGLLLLSAYGLYYTLIFLQIQ